MSARPFHKWTGGKGWLVRHHAHLLPSRLDGRLIAPFLGGGAVELHLLSALGCRALLADAEPRLVNAWVMVRDKPEEVIEALARLGAATPYRREDFETVRERMNAAHHRGEGGVEQAARFLLVLFWGFNGLWRVNGAGDCNTPFGAPPRAGAPPPPLGDPARILAASRALAGVELRCQDFAATVAEAGPGDLLFADPPYDPLTPTACFTGYGGGNWGTAASAGGAQASLFGLDTGVHLDEQERLALALRGAAERGARAIATNHATARVRRLYQGWEQVEVAVGRPGSCDGGGRGTVGELVMRAGWGAEEGPGGKSTGP